jgi:hypothetical protein
MSVLLAAGRAWYHAFDRASTGGASQARGRNREHVVEQSSSDAQNSRFRCCGHRNRVGRTAADFFCQSCRSLGAFIRKRMVECYQPASGIEVMYAYCLSNSQMHIYANIQLNRTKHLPKMNSVRAGVIVRSAGIGFSTTHAP